MKLNLNLDPRIGSNLIFFIYKRVITRDSHKEIFRPSIMQFDTRQTSLLRTAGRKVSNPLLPPSDRYTTLPFQSVFRKFLFKHIPP